MSIVIPAIVLGLLGLILGIGLNIAGRMLALKSDPRFDTILGFLPGANCGACGFAGCSEFARATVEGKAAPGICLIAEEEAINEIAKILGVDAGSRQKLVARIHCCGELTENRQKGDYEGVKTCLGAMLVSGGIYRCSYGCMNLGDCINVCPFDAIKLREGLPPEIDEKKCTGCGLCVKACPKNLIELVPIDKKTLIACLSNDRGKITRQVCGVGCIGCGICVKRCPNKAITLTNNLARIDYNQCNDCGECVKVCPRKCIIG